MKIFLITLVFFAFVVSFEAQSAYWVEGRVVDAERRPIAGAIVLLVIPYEACESCFGQIVPAFKTSADGEFLIKSSAPLDSNAELLVGGLLPEGLWTPLVTGDPYLEKFDEFRGVRLAPPVSGGTIQLGNIEPRFLYGAVELNLGELFNSKHIISKDSTIKFDLFYNEKKLATDLWIDKKVVDLDTQILKIALPKGNWRIVVKVLDGSSLNIKTVTIKAE